MEICPTIPEKPVVYCILDSNITGTLMGAFLMPRREELGSMTAHIKLDNGSGVKDWPLISEILSSNPTYIAMVHSVDDVGGHVPENRMLVVPWLERGKVIICTTDGAKQMLDEMDMRLRAIRQVIIANGCQATE